MYKQMNMIQNNIVSSPKQGKPRWNPGEIPVKGSILLHRQSIHIKVVLLVSSFCSSHPYIVLIFSST